MNAGSESREEATSRMREELNTAKTKTRIGYWNVRTMYESGKLAQVTSEMKRYSLHILGVSESRWTGSGRIKTSTGETVLYSGREDDKHHEGVAIILKKGLEKCLLEWKPVSSRLMKIRMKGRHANTTVLQCYAPTNDSDDTEKDDFYDQLQTEMDLTPRHDLIIVMGDLNAKVGRDNMNYERVMGKHGIGTRNENGGRLVDFCAMNNLVIGGTLFTHREIHKLTWNSPNGRDKNQIDHLMISGMWRRSLQDVKVKRGADVASDHHLVTALVKIKLKRSEIKTYTQRHFSVQNLRESRVRNDFNLQLKNRFQALRELDKNNPEARGIDQEWDRITNIYTESSKACLGFNERGKNKEWIQQRTWDAIKERKDIKRKLLQAKSGRLKERYQHQYTETNKEVKRLIRLDKREAMEQLAEEAEEAAARGEQGKLHKITKRICGKLYGRSSRPIKDKNGKLLTTEREQNARWTEHFQELLNQPPPEERIDIPNATDNLDIITDPPMKEEIVTAIKSLKNNKAPGKDNLNAELFKADPELSATILQPLFTAIWETEEVPRNWNEGIIVKIPKKGALNNCNNWRGITLLSIPSKILGKIIVMRMSDAVDKSLRKEQAGFRKGKGCIDQIFTLRNIIEQCTEWQRQLYVNFVDFEKAFDSIHRESIWLILRHYGIPSKIVELIKSFYQNFSCTVGNNDISFEVKTGVRQGCVMSTILFNLVIDWVMRKTTEDTPRGIRWTLFSSLEDLDFADDLALLSHTHQHMHDKTQRLHAFGRKVGLRINQKKTETMTLNVKTPAAVQVGDKSLPITEQFKYLGSIIRPEGGTKEDIQSRLGNARAVFRNMNNIWRSIQYGTNTKIRLYQSCVLSTLLYGSECWRMTESDLAKLSSFHTTCLRRILRIFWPDKISNQDLLRQCSQDEMADIITRRRWRWLGHVLRKETSSIPKTALHWTPEGRRRRGRPKVTWRRTIEAEIKSFNHSWGTLTKMAQDRQRWCSFVAALSTSGCNRN